MLRVGFLLCFICLFCTACATYDADYTYRPNASSALAKEDVELRLRANMQFVLDSATGKPASAFADHLVFDTHALIIRGNQYLRFRYSGATPVPAKTAIAYGNIHAIKLMKKGSSYRVFLFDENDIELLRAVGTNRDVMWLFVDSLVSYGGLDPKTINNGNAVEKGDARKAHK